MNYDLFRRRQQHSGLSLWELGDLLGVHPHHLHVSDTSGALFDQPVRVLIDLARQLDMHPVDLVPGLEPLLDNCRDPARHDTPPGRASGDAVAGGEEQGPAGEPAADTDARTVLAALATAQIPVTVDELATVLGWTLDRTAASIDHACNRPALAGPYALRRVSPTALTLAPRLDQLTEQQRVDLIDLVNHRTPLTVAQAEALLAAINVGGLSDYETWRDDHVAAEQQLKERGLIHTINRPHRIDVHPDVLLSLRYHRVVDEPDQPTPTADT